MIREYIFDIQGVHVWTRYQELNFELWSFDVFVKKIYCRRFLYSSKI